MAIVRGKPLPARSPGITHEKLKGSSESELSGFVDDDMAAREGGLGDDVSDGMFGDDLMDGKFGEEDISLVDWDSGIEVEDENTVGMPLSNEKSNVKINSNFIL